MVIKTKEENRSARDARQLQRVQEKKQESKEVVKKPGVTHVPDIALSVADYNSEEWSNQAFILYAQRNIFSTKSAKMEKTYVNADGHMLRLMGKNEYPKTIKMLSLTNPKATSASPLSDRIQQELIAYVILDIDKEHPFADKSMKDMIKKLLPEAGLVYAETGFDKPIKFQQAITIKKAPADFQPSGLNDTASRIVYDFHGGKVDRVISYSYDTMMNMVPDISDRQVTVPEGHRVWVVTYDGMSGGYWSQVDVYVPASDPVAVYSK
jgi:hypothetical protein